MNITSVLYICLICLNEPFKSSLCHCCPHIVELGVPKINITLVPQPWTVEIWALIFSFLNELKHITYCSKSSISFLYLTATSWKSSLPLSKWYRNYHMVSDREFKLSRASSSIRREKDRSLGLDTSWFSQQLPGKAVQCCVCCGQPVFTCSCEIRHHTRWKLSLSIIHSEWKTLSHSAVAPVILQG